MAIVNATPDSFYAGSRHVQDDALLCTVDRAVADGAVILDVGGCSTRPGTAVPSVEEEWRRVSWALSLIRAKYPRFPISVDTFRASVAERAVAEFGVGMINDISGGELDDDMLPTVARLQVPYVLMHSKGTPQTMQQLTDYEDLIPDMLRYFAAKIELLRQLGFDKEILIDPGFGFAKTVEQNFVLLRHLQFFGTFGLPVLAGLSRKSMLFKTLDVLPDAALNGTTAANMLALMGGASVLRVHDVREAVETIKIYERTFAGAEK
ncbi:MAG: dihydropteroate synthase [Paludibacteraceae bacterium]